MPGTYRDLIVWQRAMDLVEQFYVLSRFWPSEERYGLTSQIRRAAVSIPSNIAEGNGRQTPGEGVQFLGTAMGSLFEIETQASIAKRVGMISESEEQDLLAQTAEVGRLLGGLIRSRKQQRRNKLSGT